MEIRFDPSVSNTDPSPTVPPKGGTPANDTIPVGKPKEWRNANAPGDAFVKENGTVNEPPEVPACPCPNDIATPAKPEDLKHEKTHHTTPQQKPIDEAEVLQTEIEEMKGAVPGSGEYARGVIEELGISLPGQVQAFKFEPPFVMAYAEAHAEAKLKGEPVQVGDLSIESARSAILSQLAEGEISEASMRGIFKDNGGVVIPEDVSVSNYVQNMKPEDLQKVLLGMITGLGIMIDGM